MKYRGKTALTLWEGVPFTRRQLIKGGAVGAGGVAGVLALGSTVAAAQGSASYSLDPEPDRADTVAQTAAPQAGQFVSAGSMQPATDPSNASLLRPFDPMHRSTTIQNVGKNPVRLAYSNPSMWDFGHPPGREGFPIVLKPGEEFVDAMSRSPLFAVADAETVLKFNFVVGGAA